MEIVTIITTVILLLIIIVIIIVRLNRTRKRTKCSNLENGRCSSTSGFLPGIFLGSLVMLIFYCFRTKFWGEYPREGKLLEGDAPCPLCGRKPDLWASSLIKIYLQFVHPFIISCVAHYIISVNPQKGSESFLHLMKFLFLSRI